MLERTLRPCAGIAFGGLLFPLPPNFHLIRGMSSTFCTWRCSACSAPFTRDRFCAFPVPENITVIAQLTTRGAWANFRLQKLHLRQMLATQRFSSEVRFTHYRVEGEASLLMFRVFYDLLLLAVSTRLLAVPGGSAISSRKQTSFLAIAVIEYFAFDKSCK